MGNPMMKTRAGQALTRTKPLMMGALGALLLCGAYALAQDAAAPTAEAAAAAPELAAPLARVKTGLRRHGVGIGFVGSGVVDDAGPGLFLRRLSALEERAEHLADVLWRYGGVAYCLDDRWLFHCLWCR